MLDDTIRKAIAGLASDGADCLIAGTAEEMARLAQSAPGPERPEGVMVVAPATAAVGAAKALIDRWGADKKLQIVFTGYLQPGSPAADAGLAKNDVITAVNDTTVRGSTDLNAAMSPYHPGDKVKITWTDSSGKSHTETVTLILGPPA